MTFNIAFFADTHCGYAYGTRDDATGTNLRVRDGYNALHEIIEDIIRHKDEVDAVVHGGDLFHTSSPSVRDIATVQFYLRALSRAGLSIDLLAGNHDANDDRQYPAAVAVVDDPEREIFAHYKPYVRRNITDGVTLHVLSHHGLHGDDIPNLAPENGAINIFTSHGAAVDPANSALMRCMDSPREQIIAPDLVLDEDYSLRLLGHYHSRYSVGGPELNTWYAGSTLRRGFSDAPGARGWMLFKIHDDGTVTVENHDIFQRPQFDLEIIDGAQMTAAAIQEQILANIALTRKDEIGEQFDPLHAPIVRQRVVNVSRGTREGIDRNLLVQKAAHALKWQLEFLKPVVDAPVEMPVGEDGQIIVQPSVPSMTRASSLDVTEHYSHWKEHSNTLLLVPNTDREIVDVGAHGHLQKAQDAANE